MISVIPPMISNGHHKKEVEYIATLTEKQKLKRSSHQTSGAEVLTWCASLHLLLKTE